MVARLDAVAKIKLVVFPLCFVPLLLLVGDVLNNQLGPDPAKTLTLSLGVWSLRFLCLTLAVTPLRKLAGINKLIRFRRMLGLFSLFYALLHVLSYLAFMLGWHWPTLIEDLYKRPYIIVGALALLILLILGMTSTKAQIKRLGRNWSKIHKLIYPAAALVVAHFFWLVKSDYSEPSLYGVIVFALLFLRLSFIARFNTGR